jgi:hypothetical protein
MKDHLENYVLHQFYSDKKSKANRRVYDYSSKSALGQQVGRPRAGLIGYSA